MTDKTPAQQGREIVERWARRDDSFVDSLSDRVKSNVAAFLPHVDQQAEDLRKAEQQIAVLTEAAREYRRIATKHFSEKTLSIVEQDAALAKAGITL